MRSFLKTTGIKSEGALDIMIPIILLILHLVCCAVIYIGIKLQILKIQSYLMPFVLFVPVSGVLCCLLLHFQLFFRRDNKVVPSIGKMRNDQDIYRSISAKEDTQKEIIPLEEALIVNDAKTRRNLIMDVLNDHPEKYLDVLLQARMNEDVEVVHYATASMAELSKSYDEQFQQLESALSKDPEDDEILKKLCAFLKTYLSQGLIKGKMERFRRERYSELLVRRLEHAKNLSVFADLTENELNLKHYNNAALLLDYMKGFWQNEEQYQMILLRYYVEMKQRSKIEQQIAYIDSQNLYITLENRKNLDYWRTTAQTQQSKKLEPLPSYSDSEDLCTMQEFQDRTTGGL